MCRNYNVCVLPLVVAIILGIIIGALFFAGIIAAGIIAVPLAIGLIFAAITLILLFVIAAFENKKETKECVCDYGRCLALGAFVTLDTGFIALTFLGALAAGAIVSALLIGIFAFALILNFLSFVGLLVCLINGKCRRNYINNICCKYDTDYIE